MIKCKINKTKGNGHLKTTGDIDTVLVETLTLIKQLYRGIVQQSPDAAKHFKNTIIGVLLDPNSPVWKEENHE